MNGSEKQTDWSLDEYNQLCQRDRTDGVIFWNKITLLVSINFALFGILSIKENSSDLVFRIIFIFSGIIFTSFWWIVIARQAKWVDYWKKEIKEREKKRGFKIKVQTEGDKFGDALGCLTAGSYRYVAHILPVFFLLVWIATLIYVLIK